MTKLNYHELGHGISRVDTFYVRPGLASCYLIEQNGHAAFIDCGTHYTVASLVKLLDEKNIPIENLDYVIPTHIHLDHAGGAGELMRLAPNAQLIVHPRGTRHMEDPSRLQAGATAVYGEAEFKKHYSHLTPIEQQRIISAKDGFCLDFQGRKLTFLDTPGHAKHHVCIIDKSSQGMFTGDTFGVAYPELSTPTATFIFPPSSPVDFDPSAWEESIDRLIATGAQRAYLTHYGVVENLQVLAVMLKDTIKAFVQFTKNKPSHTELSTLVTDHLLRGAQQTGCLLNQQEITDILQLDIDLITQGLEVWIEKNNNN